MLLSFQNNGESFVLISSTCRGPRGEPVSHAARFRFWVTVFEYSNLDGGEQYLSFIFVTTGLWVAEEF